MKGRRKALSCIIMVMILLVNTFGTYFPVFAGAGILMSIDSGVKKGIKASGIYKNWDGVTNVAQFEGADGNMYIAVDDTSTVTIYKTSPSLSVTGSVVLTKQHSLFGTALCDKDGNFYLVTGEENSGTDTSVETVFISKYSSSGAHIATTGDNGSSSLASYYEDRFYTKTPFHAGCCDAAISGKVLAVNYARTMYSGHQSNSVFAVNIDTMDKVSPGNFYESHSFAQRSIAVNDGFVFMSEGDCYDRGFVTYILNMSENTYSSSKESNIFDFWVEQGAFDKYDMTIVNNNFAHMGGMAALSNGNIAFAASSVKSLNSNAESESEDIFIQIFIPSKDLKSAEGYVTSGVRSGVAGNNGDKDVTDYGVKWLTSLDSNEKIENVQIAATSDDEIVILYEYSKDNKYKGVYYMILDATGNVVLDAARISDEARLNPCEMPVYVNGRVCWAGNKYGDSSNTVYLYALDFDVSSIETIDISNCTIEDVEDRYYTGEEIKPAVTVKDGDTVLVEGTDYSVSYQNNINAGPAMINISGGGNYCGIVSKTFNILPKSIADLTFTTIPEQEYTGNPITPGITVKDGEKTLTEETDYTVKYENNLEPGTATAQITGKGNYTGEKSLTFIIKKPKEPATVSAIKLDETSLTLKVGNHKRLVATVEPKDAVYTELTWTSSDSGVATVSGDGLITALSEGYTVITVAVDGVKAECKVTVSGDELPKSALNPTVVVDDITEEIYLVKGQKFTLNESGWTSSNRKYLTVSKKNQVNAKKVTDAPVQLIKGNRRINVHISKPAMGKGSIVLESGANREVDINYEAENLPVVWSSSNPDIAVVSEDGNVTGVAKGSVTITAYINGKAYNRKVNVKESTAAAERTLHMTVGSTKNISIKGLKNAVWASEDGSVASVDGKKITAVAPGETTISTEYGGQLYNIVIYVENPAIVSSVMVSSGKNRYKLNLTQGEAADIIFEDFDRDVIFKSSKADIAFADEDMIIWAARPGKAKLSAKVNDKNIIINVIVQ